MTPKIVFLDEASVQLGDLDLRPITRHGHYQAYPQTNPTQLKQRTQHADIVITNKCQLTKNILEQMRHVKLICLSATGINNVEVGHANRLGIALTNVKAYSTSTVAEQTLMFMLALSHRLLEHHSAVFTKKWCAAPLFTMLDFPFSDLQGKILGIIGYGQIGRRVARLAKTFGMKILIAVIPGRTYPTGIQRTKLAVLLKQSDFVSLHCPLSTQTHQLINKKTLSLMKPSAYLLNLARGPIVNEADLAHVLQKKQIAGYASDVLSQEPPPKNHPLLKPSLKTKVLLTPHVAWASKESRQRLINEIGKNIEAFLKGKRRNRVGC